MQRYIPLLKQSKCQRREHYRKQRGNWGDISPVTRTVPNGRCYDRSRIRKADRTCREAED